MGGAWKYVLITLYAAHPINRAGINMSLTPSVVCIKKKQQTFIHFPFRGGEEWDFMQQLAECLLHVLTSPFTELKTVATAIIYCLLSPP